MLEWLRTVAKRVACECVEPLFRNQEVLLIWQIKRGAFVFSGNTSEKSRNKKLSIW
jgi:hypothetical protein